MVDNSSIPDSNFMQNMLELGNNVLKVQENYNLIIEQNKSLEKEMKKCMAKLEVDNDKNLLNIQNNVDQKIKLFQKEITNKLEQQFKENYQSLELKIQKIEEENKDKITNLEKIIQQKDEKINLLEGEVKKQVIHMQADYIQHFLEFQNEIKEIKTENEANIKAIKQKNKEKYQQLETENKNRMEKLKEIIKEKEVKITSLDADIKQLYEMNSSSKKRNEELIFEFEQLSVKKQKTDQIIQSLETKIKQNENEYLNRIKLMEENVQQKEDKINSLDIQAKKGNETMDALNKKIVKLTEDQENLIYYIVYKRPKYIQIKNKWKEIDRRVKCCEGDCTPMDCLTKERSYFIMNLFVTHKCFFDTINNLGNFLVLAV